MFYIHNTVTGEFLKEEKRTIFSADEIILSKEDFEEQEAAKKFENWIDRAMKMLLDCIFELTEKQKNDFMILKAFHERNGTLPPLPEIAKNMSEIYVFLVKKIKEGKLDSHPLT